MNQEHLVNFQNHILRRNASNQRTITLHRRRVMLGGIYFNERTGLNTGYMEKRTCSSHSIACMQTRRVRGFQFWQQNNEPIELNTNKLPDNTLHYKYYNPVEAGFVSKLEDWI